MDQITITHEHAQELIVMLEAYRALHVKAARLHDIISDTFKLKWDPDTLTILIKTIMDEETPEEG